MLILSRFRNEVIVIEAPNGDLIKIQVVDIRGDKVRLGFDADQDYQIHRQEVWEQVVADGKNRSASQ